MKSIGKYQLFAEIHKGPITTLYKAFHQQLDRIVLIKQLNPERIGDKDLYNRFQQEGLIIAKINHANVISIFDYGIDNDVPFLVMEFIEGITLFELLQEQKILPIDISIYILYQVCLGLLALHKKNFIHRDIKPSNILISHEGHVKIGDLGFSESKLTATDLIWGTPAYMAPEVILSQKADERSDIFSLGVVFYEMLCGENPFDAKSISVILHQIVNNEPMSIKKYQQDTPDEIVSLCHQMLNKNPDQRYASIKQLLEELEPFARNITTESLLKFLHEPQEYSNSIFQIAPFQAVEQNKKIKYSFHVYDLLFTIILSLLLILLIKSDSNKHFTNKLQTENIHLDSAQVTVQDQVKNATEIFPQTNLVKKEKVDFYQQNKPILIHNDKSFYIETSEDFPIFFTSDPRAWLLINGDSIGITPTRYAIASIPNTLELTLTSPGLPTIKKAITINTVTDNKWHISLWKEVGYLTISVNPWGEIWIDDDSIDVTPLLHPLILAPGSHQLKIRHPYLKEEQEKIFIIAGDTLKRTIALKKTP